MWFLGKSKKEKHQELLGWWKKFKEKRVLTTAELKEIIQKQPSLADEAINELFLYKKDLEKLIDFYGELYFGEDKSEYYGNRKVAAASRKVAEKLINDYNSTLELCKIFNCLIFPELREKTARKILQAENVSIVPTTILREIIIRIDSSDLKGKAAEEILKREIPDTESECLAWIIAYVGSPQREKALDAIMKRKNWNDNLLLLFNLNKNPDNVPFVEKVAKNFLETNNDGNEKILFSIIYRVKGDIGKMAAKKLLPLLLEGSSLDQLILFIWRCEEYPDLQESAAREILKQEKKCEDGNIFYCIVRDIRSLDIKEIAAGVILDRFANTRNLKFVVKNVPSLKKQAKEMLKKIELAESESPEGLFKRIINFKN